MRDHVAWTAVVVIDPKRTWAWSKSRSAAVSWLHPRGRAVPR